MNQIPQITPKNIAIIGGIIVGTLIVGFFIFKMFKKCCRYCFINDKRFFNLANVIVFALPFGLLVARNYYKIEFLYTSSWIMIATFVVCIGTPVIINIVSMGPLYGLSMSFFRLIIGLFGLCMGYGILFVVALAAFGSIVIVDSILSSADCVITTTDGRAIHVWRNGSGSLIGDDGNIYTPCGSNSLSCSDGSFLYFY